MMDRGQWANLARMPGLHSYSFLPSKGQCSLTVYGLHHFTGVLGLT